MLLLTLEGRFGTKPAAELVSTQSSLYQLGRVGTGPHQHAKFSFSLKGFD
jgi:hypothetical protein